ncbi:hypothetical protein [Amycolatopsis japonica]
MDHLVPLPTLSPATRKYGLGPVLIVKGTLAATYDRTMSASSNTAAWSSRSAPLPRATAAANATASATTRGIALIRNLAMTV